MKSLLSFLILETVLLIHQTNGHVPFNVTIVNELRDFRPLYLGDSRDYFVSNKKATVDDAKKVCKSIGDNFHLITIENEGEYRRILPYLRGLDLERIWTSGEKNASQTVWTQPSPSFSMDFKNFPIPSSNKSINFVGHGSSVSSKIPRCRNGFLTPRCTPGKCTVDLEPCKTTTPSCSITSCPSCSSQRPDCGATCNNCIVIQPVCQVIQEPCIVTTKPCQTIRPPCTIETKPCTTSRPPCSTVYPPCQISTPKPCTTTARPPCKTTTVCTTTKPPCAGGKCPPPETSCEPVTKCQPDPEVCSPDAIICPSPIITCPPEETTCEPPTVHCPNPVLDCPEPEVDCPLPRTHCTPPKVTCDSPEVNCPGVIVNCPAPSFNCPSPQVYCPPPKVECDEPEQCVYPDPPVECPYEDEKDEDDTVEVQLHGSQCDDCLATGCVALKRDSDFKWKVEDCSTEFHFVCEGKA